MDGGVKNPGFSITIDGSPLVTIMTLTDSEGLAYTARLSYLDWCFKLVKKRFRACSRELFSVVRYSSTFQSFESIITNMKTPHRIMQTSNYAKSDVKGLKISVHEPVIFHTILSSSKLLTATCCRKGIQSIAAVLPFGLSVYFTHQKFWQANKSWNIRWLLDKLTNAQDWIENFRDFLTQSPNLSLGRYS